MFVLQKRIPDEKNKTNNDVYRFARSEDLCWVSPTPRDLNEELQKIRAENLVVPVVVATQVL